MSLTPLEKGAMVFQLMSLIAWFIIILEILSQINARIEMYYLLLAYIVFSICAASFKIGDRPHE
jgi:hypothetical protein